MRYIKNIILIGLLVLIASPVLGEKKETYLTKGDVIQMLANSSAVKQKINELFSWTAGYDASKINKGRFTPTINYVQVTPRSVPPDGKTIFDLVASINDPGGLKNVAGVRADLSAIGQLPNMAMIDTGTFGDTKEADGRYTLQSNVEPKTALGGKDIQITATNKKGWLALVKTSIEVRKDPIIRELRVFPGKVLADGSSLATIEVAIDNPGGSRAVRTAVVNLWSLGLADRAALSYLGDDIWAVEFVVPGNQGPGRYQLPVEVTNLAGGVAVGSISVDVTKK